MNKHLNKIFYSILILTTTFFTSELFSEESSFYMNHQNLLPIFSPELDNFSVEQITDPKLRETMQAIFQYRENAKKFILEAEQIRKSIKDKLLKDAIAGALCGTVVALPYGITTIMISASLNALANITVNLMYQYYDILELVEKAKQESEKADILEKYVLVNAFIS